MYLQAINSAMFSLPVLLRFKIFHNLRTKSGSTSCDCSGVINLVVSAHCAVSDVVISDYFSASANFFALNLHSQVDFRCREAGNLNFLAYNSHPVFLPLFARRFYLFIYLFFFLLVLSHFQRMQGQCAEEHI